MSSSLLQTAVAQHQAGNLAGAERLYREVLSRDARQPDAWHLLGLVHYARGEWEAAEQHIAQAIELDPRQATFHNHLAEARLSQGNLVGAEAAARAALVLEPGLAIAHNTLGTIQAAGERRHSAIESYRRATELSPDFAQAHFNLGNLLSMCDDQAAAIAALARAVEIKPDYLRALRLLATLLQSSGRAADAALQWQAVLRLEGEDAATLCNLGSAFKDVGRTEDAARCYRRAIELDPLLPEAHFNLGVLLQHARRPHEARRAYEAAIRARPDYTEAHVNLGAVCKGQGDYDLALASYNAAERSDPDSVEMHRNRALLRLLRGDFERGWPEYEWRWQVSGAALAPVEAPRWQGDPLAGGTLLLRAEQGLGDTIQLIRYAQLVKQRSQATVLVDCPRVLHAVLAGVPGVDRFVTGELAVERFDAWIPLLSLPAIFGTTLASVPAQVPYLFVEPQRTEYWRGELARHEGFRVGIAWQGNPGYAADFQRSVPLAEFVPLADLPGVQLFNLQKKHGLEQLPPLAERLKIVDLAPQLDQQAAFVDTAAVMQGLDLVVVSDSALAHLAGALGVPVWVALPHVPDWRWLLDREDSPWYPTMRLFRQTSLGDWATVFERIAAEIMRDLRLGTKGR